MKRNICIFCISGLMLISLITGLPASELTYTPTNPSFGGSPLNGSVLMGSANAQNTFKEKKDLLQDFDDQLNRRILSNLARKITDSSFGQDDLSPGHYNIGDITVDVVDGGDDISVSITDFSTGGSTTIKVPTY